LAVPHVPAARAGATLRASVAGAWSAVAADRVLRLAVIGSAFYWMIASLLAQNILVYEKAVLAVPDARSGLPLALFGLGVGLGAVLAARLSAAKVEVGLIPLGALGLAVFSLALALLAPGFVGLAVLLALLGISSGLIVVPLDALLQWRSPADRRGSVIALANVFVFGGVLAGSLLAEALARAGLSPRGILAGAAVATLAGTLWALRLLPVALLRLGLVLLTHTFYRLKVLGRERVPAVGPALLVPNHVSFVDALVVLTALDRPVRFIADTEYFEKPLFKPFMTALGAIPISSAGGPRVILRALRDAGRFLDQGDLVCIFAEGQITRTGMLLPFRRGLERIVKGRSAPIVPVHLDRLWGSIFSRAGGRFVWKIPERVPYPVTVSFGAPLPAGASIQEIRSAVQELATAAWEQRRADRRPLHREFRAQARRRPFLFCFADPTRKRMSRFAALSGAVALARALRAAWAGQPHVGILLPPSIAGALANVAASFAGRTSVNLNYTAGPAALESACRQAGLHTILTSRAFLERVKLELPAEPRLVYVEDLRASIGPGRRLLAAVLALLAPARLLERACGAERTPRVDDTVTVIFSSGSTGEPKGVLLTHFNIDSNVEAVAQVFRVERRDRLLGILPLFHSFGYLALWMCLNRRIGCVFHPNPLDTGTIGQLVQRYEITVLIATPTFLQLYLRRCTPAQFGSLRVVIAGAEKLSERLALAFEDAFGIRPLEGYGTTECSPAIAMSATDFRAPGFYQPGSRRGSVGQPLPGVSVRIVDPDTLAPLPPGVAGMLVVKGPNVMRGYLGRDDLNAKVLRDGWYLTGDIATIDEDGFLRITDRLLRFSKIGGEMVPHGRVEEALHEAAGATTQLFAVTAVPDEKKGERLAVLHTTDPAKLPAILEKLAELGLPNLFVPRADAFVHVESLPLLGTGKLDLREMKRRATEALVKA
ncbi:MAG TPA: AMP-binding protein, partial [Candidatus Polarisedimenticolaceae bacterium]|nr:AMP-binding protein [Candidatus Polarisedimenticolaceae bacterium]